MGHDCTLKKQPPKATLPLLLAHFFGLTLSLEGNIHRVERLADNVGRDRAWMLEVQQAVELFIAAGGTLPLGADPEPRIRDARWMLEGLRLSLFAQPLGVRRGETTIRAYPALVDEGGSVAIRLQTSVADQVAAHRAGVRRLVQLGVPSPLAYIQEHLTGAEKLSLGASPYRSTAALIDDALRAVIDAELSASADDARDALPWNRAAFESLRDRVNAGLPDRLFGIVATTAAVLAAAREVDVLIARSSSLQLMAPLAEAREQLNALVHDGFIGRTGLARLPRLVVYLRGIAYRVERLADNLGRDRAWMLEVQQAVELYTAAGGTLPLAADPEARIREARWMLEELRLSLFAQPLGAQGPISVQRIRKQPGG